MAKSESSQDLELIEGDHAFLKNMLDLIPPHYYFDNEAKEQLLKGNDETDIAAQKGVSVVQGKRFVQLSRKSKQKRAKLNPSQMQTVSQLQDKLLASDTVPKRSRPRKEAMPPPADAESDDDGLGGSIDSMDNLRERLHAKIEALQAQRNKLNRDDAVEKNRIRRRMSKMKLKMKKKYEKQGQEKMSSLNDVVHHSPPPPILNKEGQMVFSKFDFSSESAKKRKAPVPTGKNYQHLLERVSKEKKAVEEVRTTQGVQAAHDMTKATQWKAALQRAEGVKVKDDPQLLKRSLKLRENRKKKSSKQWKERSEKITEQKKSKQEKRDRNLNKRKQANIDKKIKRSKKKGRMIPGF